jgi:hypothetical protein
MIDEVFVILPPARVSTGVCSFEWFMVSMTSQRLDGAGGEPRGQAVTAINYRAIGELVESDSSFCPQSF